MSECSKLAQKEYMTRHDWVGKVIHWELCKKLKFIYTNKWYMQQPRICREEWDAQTPLGVEIQTDHLISARRPNLEIINKKKRTCRIMDFSLLADDRVKLKENEKKDKYLDFAQELKKNSVTWTVIAIIIGTLSTVIEGLIPGPSKLQRGWDWSDA